MSLSSHKLWICVFSSFLKKTFTPNGIRTVHSIGEYSMPKYQYWIRCVLSKQIIITTKSRDSETVMCLELVV